MSTELASKLSNPQKQQLQALRQGIQATLKSYGHTLTTFAFAMFGFYKEQFDLNSLAILLNRINNTLSYSEADVLMRALGDLRAGVVYMKDLELFLTQNNKKGESFQKKIEEFAQLLKESDPLSSLQSYDLDNDNHLTVEEMDQLLSYYDLFTAIEKQYIIKQLFGAKTAVSIPELIKVLNLSLTELYEQQKPCSLMNLSKNKISPDTNIKIPEVLRGCLNYNTRINQELLDYLGSIVSSGKRYVDMNKPIIKPQHHYVHISQLYKQYFLFEMRTSVVNRDAFRTRHGLYMEARNIRQGHGKDCYILSALSGVVEYYPEHTWNLFLIDKTDVDIYVVKLFIDGEWKLVICDAEFPVNNKGKLVYAQPSKHQIWVLLIQKAWAKIFGSYIAIEEGSNEQGFVAVTGAPCLRFETNKPEDLGKIKYYLKKGYIASVSTNKLDHMSREEQKSMGIYANHAYTLLYIVENAVDNLTKQTVTLLYLRNPWGRGVWKGNWSFDYAGWSRQLREKLNYVKNPKDGSFYINLEDFRKYFSKIKICCINPSFVNSSIRLKSNAKQYVANKFTIKQKGDYFLSIYQENKRKYKHTGKQYKMSNANIYIARLKEDKYIQPIGSKAANNSNLSIQVSLQPGEYVCLSRVKWNSSPEGQFVLTSYGPRPITFSSVTLKENFLSEFVRLRAADEIGDKSYYGKLGSSNSYKIVFMSSDLGYGYILICNNQQNRSMRGTLTLSNAKGIKMIPPLDFTIKVNIKPRSREVYPCVVSSNGFEYKLTEQMILN